MSWKWGLTASWRPSSDCHHFRASGHQGTAIPANARNADLFCRFRGPWARWVRKAADLALYRTVQGLEKQVCAACCPSLIPGGDRESSRGQRPRKTHPPQGPTLKGSNQGGVTPVLLPATQRNATPSGSGNERRTFRGRCPRLLSCALAGHEKPTLRSYPAAPRF